MSIKRAIGYCRISTRDQSNFSLDGQQTDIRRYCDKMGWQLIGMHIDDGQSAKNFDRVQWKALEAYIKKNFKQIDYLVVMKYDRFSRNVSEALSMLNKLETTYSIKVISTMENIGLHPNSPYFFQFRAQMLMNAELELRVIRDRTKFGMVNAARNGQYTGTAPFGYINGRNDQNKPILLIHERRATIVKKAFQMFTSGITMAEISRLLQKEGLSLKGNSAMQRMLSNPIYTGLVHVPEYYDDPEQLVASKNPAIIDRDIWWKAQAILSGKEVHRVVYNEEVPLRGVLKCHCGHPLTAGNSKGKNKYYWYYKCPNHKKENLSATKLHNQFDALLDELSLSDAQIRYFQKGLAKEVEKRLSEHNNTVREKQKELAAVTHNLESLEEKYIRNTIDADTYSKWRIRYQDEAYTTKNIINDLMQPVNLIWSKYEEHLSSLQNIRFLYNRRSLQSKQLFIRLVFNNTLRYENGSYRTLFLAPLFGLKAASLKEKGLLLIEQPSGISKEIPVSSEDGS